jgi:hypothetical protein
VGVVAVVVDDDLASSRLQSGHCVYQMAQRSLHLIIPSSNPILAAPRPGPTLPMISIALALLVPQHRLVYIHIQKSFYSLETGAYICEFLERETHE